MADRLLVDLGRDGRVRVVFESTGGLPEVVGEFKLKWPLDGDALEDLRWYLEDYLRAPFGVYEERGPRLQGRLAEWGEEIFAAVFGSGSARDAYVRTRAAGRPLEVVFRSDSPALLSLPWELMADPGRGVPLALEVAGMSRSLPTAKLGDPFEISGGRLRVLMVISRPLGTRDVGFRMIARPLLGRLAAVRGQVDLVVLRPPTLAALRETLERAVAIGEPFQVVHFDGHGALPGRTAAGVSGTFADPGDEGVLVFQQSDGSADHVSAGRVAAALRAGRVPVAVLNACQSGALGKALEATVATRLLREGAASVVAMAYSVYAVAAAEFMAAFYEALFAGESVSAAVAAGRRRLFEQDSRPSPKGEMQLADWMVPVYYWRREVRFPGLVTPRPTGMSSLTETLDNFRAEASVEDGTSGTFVGRDDLFLDLETAVRLQRVVVLHGPGGTGKTELVRAFANWWQATGGTEEPSWVFWHSFEPGSESFGLDSVVNEIGLQLFGADFAKLEQGERTRLLVRILRERRMLLVWDNFETIHTMPDPNAAAILRDDTGATLQEFLLQIAALGGASAVLVTSRTKEEWLGPVRHIAVGGLSPEEAAEYAGILLAPYPRAGRRRVGRAFGELMEWLDGHPLSMRIILPLLDSTGPGELLDGLRGTVPLPGPDTGDRASSLPASITYSFQHLGQAAQRLLPAASLCQAIADADLLYNFSQFRGRPERFHATSPQEWAAALDEAARVGLLTALGSGMYRMHPALPGYLASHWKASSPDSYQTERTAATSAMVSAAAVLTGWIGEQIETGNAKLAYRVTAMEHGTFSTMLGHALSARQWGPALMIIYALENWWEARGMTAEADAWADRIRAATETAAGIPPAIDTHAGALWIFTVGAQGLRQLGGMQLDDADATYRQILVMLQARPVSSGEHQSRLAIVYHQLGVIAQERGRLDEAEDRYRESLAINENTGDKRLIAGDCHQLGIIAQKRGRLDEAEERYREGLVIRKEIGDLPGITVSYHQLGFVAHERGRLDEAEEWYCKALAISEDLGDRPHMAMEYHSLGLVFRTRGQLNDAEEWHFKSLAIAEDLRDQPFLASNYHELGVIAQERERLAEAEEWYHKALAIRQDLGDQLGMVSSYEKLGYIAVASKQLEAAKELYSKALTVKQDRGDRPGTAVSYHTLGVIAQEQGRLDEAEDLYREALMVLEALGDRPNIGQIYAQLGLLAEKRDQDHEALHWLIRAVSLFPEIPYPTETAAVQLARLATRLGISELQRGWKDVTGSPLPRTVHDYITQYQGPAPAPAPGRRRHQ